MKLLFIIFLIIISSSISIGRKSLHTLKNYFGRHQRIVDGLLELPEHLRAPVMSDVLLINRTPLTYEYNGKKGYKLRVSSPRNDSICPSSSVQGHEDPPCHPLCDRDKDGVPQYDTKLLLADAGICSGFLVSPNLVVTAGHCFLDDEGELKRQCSSVAVVYDFKTYVDDEGNPTNSLMQVEHLFDDYYDRFYLLPQSSVYKCKRLIKAELKNRLLPLPTRHIDYAVFEIDRDISHRNSFVEVQNPMSGGRAYFRAFSIEGKEVINVGHPWRFVKLYDDDGVISDVDDQYNFKGLIDGEGGSSGSLVADKETGKALGIVVRGYANADLFAESGNNCWIRSGLGDCRKDYPSLLHDYDWDGLDDRCERVARSVSSTLQFYNWIDHNPVYFPYLAQAEHVTKPGGARLKALQKLLNYTVSGYNGIWDEDFNDHIIEKMKHTTILDSDPIYCPNCLVHEGPGHTAQVAPEILSLWIPSYCPSTHCPNSAILAMRELLRNGRTGYESVELDNDEWSSDLTNAIKDFKVSKGYPRTMFLTVPVWRHLWRTETDPGSLD